MRKTRPLFGLPFLIILAVIFGFSGISSAEGHSVFPLELTEGTTQTFSVSGTPTVWYAITTENPSNSTTHQEFSGGNTPPNWSKQSVQPQESESFFTPSAFDALDQRILIFQFLYPFHFFF